MTTASEKSSSRELKPSLCFTVIHAGLETAWVDNKIRRVQRNVLCEHKVQTAEARMIGVDHFAPQTLQTECCWSLRDTVKVCCLSLRQSQWKSQVTLHHRIWVSEHSVAWRTCPESLQVAKGILQVGIRGIKSTVGESNGEVAYAIWGWVTFYEMIFQLQLDCSGFASACLLCSQGMRTWDLVFDMVPYT